MTGPTAPRDPGAPSPDFDALYADDHDPWQVETSWYERRKLAVLLAALPRERYPSAWEPGCGPGVVSQALAAHVDDLVASDISATAVGLARARPAMPAHVRFEVSELPQVPLPGAVDLVVVAEFLYYLPDLDEALAAVWSAAAPGGHVAYLHWAHRPHDAYRSGPEMHARIGLDAMQRGATLLVSHVDRDFLLDIYEVT
ncbi:MAG: SAM-dependent methyltransferase [Nocardioidaceae bacterium]